MTDSRARAEELYRQYEADKALVMADPELTHRQKHQAITHLTDELVEAERKAGIRWGPVSKIDVEATGDGSVTIPLNKERKEAT